MNSADKVLNFFVVLVLVALVGLATYYLFFFEKKSPAESLARKIEIAHEMKDDVQALSDIAEFLTDYPDNSKLNSVYLVSTEIFLDQNQLKDAEKYLNRVIGSDNLSSSEYIRSAILLGRIHIKTHIADTITLRTLEDAYLRSSFGNKEKLANLLGSLYLISGDTLNALRFFEETKGEKGLIGKIKVELTRGNLESARLLAKQYQEIYPQGSEQQWIQSLLSLNTNQSISNANITPQTTVNNESDLTLMQKLQIAMITSNWIDGIELSRKLTENSDTSLDDQAYYFQGLIYYELKQLNLSENAMQKVTDMYPNSDKVTKAAEWKRIIRKERQLISAGK